MKLKVILEMGDDEIWARCSAPNTHITTVGKDMTEIIKNINSLVIDHIKHEGKEQAEWKDIQLENIIFVYCVDLKGFFDECPFSLVHIAEHAKMNESLLRQYACGAKNPSIKQVTKIQTTIECLMRKYSDKFFPFYDTW